MQAKLLQIQKKGMVIRMIVSLSDAAELKKEIEEKFSVKIHFCDGCGGQYFTVDRPTEELKEFITAFFAAKNLKTVFADDGEHFTVRKSL